MSSIFPGQLAELSQDDDRAVFVDVFRLTLPWPQMPRPHFMRLSRPMLIGPGIWTPAATVADNLGGIILNHPQLLHSH
jgi:hypothetical protein